MVPKRSTRLAGAAGAVNHAAGLSASSIFSGWPVRALDIATRNLDLAARATDALGGCVEQMHTPAAQRLR